MKQNNNTEKLLWQQFSETGDIKYYLLYNKIKSKEVAGYNRLEL